MSAAIPERRPGTPPRTRRDDFAAAVAAGRRAGERLVRTPLTPGQRALLERMLRASRYE